MHVHGLGTLLYCTSALLQELGLVRLLEKEEVQAGVAAANEKGDQEQASKSSPGGGGGLPAPGNVSCSFTGICIGQGKWPSSPRPNKELYPSHSLPSAPPEGRIKGKIMTSCCHSGPGSFWEVCL